jgi:hypothetical protein
MDYLAKYSTLTTPNTFLMPWLIAMNRYKEDMPTEFPSINIFKSLPSKFLVRQL